MGGERIGMNALLNYPGGKGKLAQTIVELMPPHKTYLEPFFGGGAVFFHKEPSRIETINDLDGDVVNFFRIIRDNPEALADRIAMTPYSREEYDSAWISGKRDDITRAWRFAVRSKMSWGFKMHSKTGFKTDVAGREYAYCVKNWNRLPMDIQEAAARLKDAQIENRPALELIRKYNDPNVLIYADPPYLMQTRGGRQYSWEMSVRDHEELVDALLRHKGPVILSGYASELYDRALASWNRLEIAARTQNHAERTEVLWYNFDAPKQFDREGQL